MNNHIKHVQTSTFYTTKINYSTSSNSKEYNKQRLNDDKADQIKPQYNNKIINYDIKSNYSNSSSSSNNINNISNSSIKSMINMIKGKEKEKEKEKLKGVKINNNNNGYNGYQMAQEIRPYNCPLKETSELAKPSI